MIKSYRSAIIPVVSILLGLMLASSLLTAQQPVPAAGQKIRPIDQSNFDTSVKPTDDFYRYANGGWMVKNPIPADESRWGSFNELRDYNISILREILEDAAKRTDAPKGSNLQKVGDFYASGMDSTSIEAAGIAPLKEDFDRINAIQDAAGLQKHIAYLHTMGLGVPFVLFVGQDEKQSTEVVAHFWQSGLGLPDRDYYSKEDKADVRGKYTAHITKMFELLGDDAATAAANAATVMSMETRLAKAAMARVDMRDPENTYHKMTLSELDALTPEFSFSGYFAGIGNASPGNIIVGQPDFLREMSKMTVEVPINDWKTYLRWHLIRGAADYLSSAFETEKFNFTGRVLTGVTENRPRWKRVQSTVDGTIGEALGELYVAKTFSPQAKARVKELVANLQAVMSERIKTLEWMSDATKEQALKKLNSFTVKIGYPDKWRDYSSLEIDRSSYVMNVLRSEKFEFQRQLQQIGKPVDCTEWGMTPPTVNAYYNPSMNEIVFPAGILQPPFFFADADDAVNYGGIGAVIGHEITHGFDDEGRQFDAEGNLKDWWTKEDGEKYIAKASLIEQQYSEYVALDTLKINGKLTLGENLADFAGLTISYAALQKALEGKPRPEKIDGFTPEQRFFLSFANIWRQNIRPEALKLRLMTDPHSPGEFRCNGTVANMPEFMQAFGATEGMPMVRAADKRPKIW